MYVVMYIAPLEMSRMVRKQVYLEPQQERRLKQTARALGVSEAELIRRGVSQVADVGAPGLVDPEAWVRELAFIRKRARRHKRRGGMRSWTREGLYEERLSRLPH
ncbi:hypothetical protein HRbin33_02642 [bacterium HR33]|nr:hypothetical protein HRbin33_02642 [bacterium HR33]